MNLSSLGRSTCLEPVDSFRDVLLQDLYCSIRLQMFFMPDTLIWAQGVTDSADLAFISVTVHYLNERKKIHFLCKIELPPAVLSSWLFPYCLLTDVSLPRKRIV